MQLNPSLNILLYIYTVGSHNIFQNAGIFSIPEDDTILAVRAEGFHQATTSCQTTDDGQSLLEAHENIDQHPESSLNQDQSAAKISGEPKVNFGSFLTPLCKYSF